jgi:hypothetical protein
MRNLPLKDLKEWYMEAVKGDLVLNHGLLPSEADRVIFEYGLQKSIDADPANQLHDDPHDVSRDMKQQGLY